jgi:putative transposase
LALIADTSISGMRVARKLGPLLAGRGKPRSVVSDNGTEPATPSGPGRRSHSRLTLYIALGKPTL